MADKMDAAVQRFDGSTDFLLREMQHSGDAQLECNASGEGWGCELSRSDGSGAS